MRLLRGALLALLLILLLPTEAQGQAPAQDQGGFVQGEKTLEARLLAPCCWAQTLDVHESDTARSLRLEIRRRLVAGETASAIEADLVVRYGERVRAVPKGGTLTPLAVYLLLAVGVLGLGVGVLLVRWAKRGRTALAPKPLERTQRDALDDRLDAELEDMPD